jgi:hypothetical protein
VVHVVIFLCSFWLLALQVGFGKGLDHELPLGFFSW